MSYTVPVVLEFAAAMSTILITALLFQLRHLGKQRVETGGSQSAEPGQSESAARPIIRVRRRWPTYLPVIPASFLRRLILGVDALVNER